MGKRAARVVRWASIVLLTAAFAGVVVWLWAQVPNWYHPEDPKRPNADSRLQAVAVTRGGILTAAGGLLILANLLESRRATNLTHARELYTEAVRQLGSDTLDVRLGGIYALERIATVYAADHHTVVDVLSAFVREHTIPGRSGATRRGRQTQGQPKPTKNIGANPTITPAQGSLDTDIQAALTILGRLPSRVDVPRGDLTGAVISHANLNEADLNEAILEGTILTRATLEETDLTGTNLKEAKLTRANLSGADLIDANLAGANLTRANLDEADLSDAQMDKADLTKAWLGGADFTDAQGLKSKQVAVAYGDRRTRLPDNVRRPRPWPAYDPD